MQIANFKQVNELIQQAFPVHHRQIAIRLILSLEDLSLHNFEFVDFIQDFAPTPQGFSKNFPLLQTLSREELQLIEHFLKEVQSTCPICFTVQVAAGLASVSSLLSKSLVS